MYKFTGKKYITRGIKEELPAVVMIYLWSLIEKRKRDQIPMDYLQIFELKRKDTSNLVIIHRQEEPTYIRRYTMKCELEIFDKIYVIDDVEHITMLFASEY